MGKTSKTSPATKADLEKLWIRIDKRFEQVDKRFEQVDKRFEQVDKRFEQVDKQFGDMRLYFDIATENMLQDFNGAFGDRVSQQNDEITGLKRRVSAIERRLRFSRR